MDSEGTNKAADGYSCANISSSISRAMVGSMPNGNGGFETRYMVIGRGVKSDDCLDVCPNHPIGPGEIAVRVDEGLIEQLYFQVKANQAREENSLRERNKKNHHYHPQPSH